MAKSQPILPSKVQRAEYGRSVYAATLEEGVTVAEITKSDFWVNLAQTLEPLDRIEAVTADGETYVELLVGRVEKINDGNRTTRIPKLFVLNQTKLGAESAAAKASAKAIEEAPAEPILPAEDESVRNQQTNRVITGERDVTDEDGDGIPDGYSVSYGGPTHKHRVLKEGVAEPLATGMTKKEAIAWAVDHFKKSA